MKIRGAVAVLCMLVSAGMAQPLFQPVADLEGQAQLIGVVGMVRYRTVEVDISRLAQFTSEGVEGSPEIVLNLFEDTVVQAQLQRVSPSPAGGWIWRGNITGPHSGQVIIAFTQETIAGMIEVDGRIIQVRNNGTSLHLIRELPQEASVHLAPLMAPASASFEEIAVYQLTNQERQARGLYPYAANDLLANAARAHSQDMGTRNFFSHTNPDGKNPGDRMRDAGYNWSYSGENIAAGLPTAAETMQGWMNSPGHRANILSTDFCDLGVGYAYVAGSTYGHYWTQNFGKLQGVVSCTPPGGGGNTPPTVSLTYTPSNPTTADTMTFTAHASDPDGDPLSYQWYTDGALFPTPSTQDSLQWVNPPAGTHTVRVVVSDGQGGTAEDTVTFTVQAAGGGGSSHTYGPVAGWYMISVPANEPLPAGLVAWSWNPLTQTYEQYTTLGATYGYWVRLPANFTLSVSGTPFATNIEVVLLVSGWYQISVPWSYPKAAIRVVWGGVEKTWAEAVAAGWIQDSIYGYRASDGHYTTPTTLDPWYGYWMKAKVDWLTLRFLYAERIGP